MNKMKTAIAAGLALVAAGSVARAAEPTGWKFEITPMAWLAGLEGDGKIRGKDFEFEKSFGDLVDSVDFAAGVLTTVQYERYLLWVQLDYISSSTDNLDAEDQPKRASIDSDMFLAETAVGYQIDGWSEGQTFDILVGFRMLNIETKLDLGSVGDFSSDKTLVDPMLVIRPNLPITEKLSFNSTLAIGGGGDADLVYEMQPQFQYDVNENVSLRLGYRRVGYKFDGEKNSELNVDLAGLIVGAGFKF
jgi:hypothetical protein